jgi:sec-independent protein translocase protein TatA
MHTFQLFFNAIGIGEWAIILAVAVLLFGGKKIPELMRGVGQGIREFNKAKNSVEGELREGLRDIKKDDTSQK